MTRNRGRPARNTCQVNVKLSNALMSEIRSTQPHLLKPGSSDFRYGALALWMENVLWREIRAKPKYQVSGQSGQ